MGIDQFDIKDGILVKYLGKDTKVEIPDTVTVIGCEAFSESYIKSVIMPDTVTKIEKSAFEACCFLEKISFSKNLQII